MEVNIIDYGMHGEGVAKIDGKIVLVPNALLGEVVDISILENHTNYSTAKINKIKVPSQNRTNSFCKTQNCGGCGLLHFSYPEQLKFKQLLVQKTIKKITAQDVNVNPTVASNKQFNYRNKASFAVSNNIGFFSQGTHNIAQVESCMLLNKNINTVLTIFKQQFQSNTTGIKNLVVRSLNNQVLVAVVATKKIDLTPFYNALKNNFKNLGLSLIINTRKDSVVLAGITTHIGGIKEITLNNFDINYTIDILSFHQTNEDVQNKIYTYVLNQINPNQTVINAYSGAGLLSAIIAKKAKSVYGVELSKSSHLMAEKLKISNKMQNLTNFNADFGKFIIKCPKADIIILDPPKKGCGKIIQKINTNKIIYISCNPISLAKDLRYLKNNYIIEEVTPFDMFPNTESVETVAILRRKNDT